MSCSACKSENNLQEHHMYPREIFRGTTKTIKLCAECHSKVTYIIRKLMWSGLVGRKFYKKICNLDKTQIDDLYLAIKKFRNEVSRIHNGIYPNFYAIEFDLASWKFPEIILRLQNILLFTSELEGLKDV